MMVGCNFWISSRSYGKGTGRVGWYLSDISVEKAYSHSSVYAHIDVFSLIDVGQRKETQHGVSRNTFNCAHQLGSHQSCHGSSMSENSSLGHTGRSRGIVNCSDRFRGRWNWLSGSRLSEILNYRISFKIPPSRRTIQERQKLYSLLFRPNTQ